VAKSGVCSECAGELTNPLAKTCGQACRQRRQRRLKRQKREAGKAHAYPEHLATLADGDLVKEVAKEELRPVVREAITEDVLRAAGRLVELTGTMVDAIAEDLASDDKWLRQKAYTLLARYTLGNTSIAPPADQSNQPMQVVFNMPRPGDALHNPSADATVSQSEAIELRQCMECQADKPVTEFMGPSERCRACHDAKRAAVLEMVGQ
jgi:hypothetical protein